MKARLAVTLVAVCALSACHAESARNSVGTISAASTRAAEPAPVAAWCSKLDLRPMPVGGPSGLAGAMAYFLQARNVAGRPCRVKGFALAAQVLTAGSRWRTVHAWRGTPLGGDYTASVHLLRRGGVAVVDLVASHARGYRGAVWRGVRLMLPHIDGWITWTGVIHPDSGVGLGPVRDSDR